MLIRKATPADFVSLAQIAVSAYMDDAMDDYLYPRRRKYPSAHRSIYLSQIQKFFSEKDSYVIVAELEPSDTMWKGSKEIVGYVQWHKQHHGMKQSCWKKLIEGFSERISNLKSHISTLFNPCASLPHSLAFDTSPSSEHHFSPTYREPPHAWAVASIAVHPSYQKLGIGMKLLEWGMDRARKEGIPAILEAMKAGQRLYEKAGFVGYGTWKWGKGEGMTSLAMRWDPPVNSD